MITRIIVYIGSDIKEYYANKIVKFFKNNGPCSGGGTRNDRSIDSSLLFKYINFEDFVLNPQNYVLYYAYNNHVFYIRVLASNVNPSAILRSRYWPVKMWTNDDKGTSIYRNVFIDDIL